MMLFPIVLTVLLVQPANSGGGTFRDGDRIVFFGDSITQNGRYISYLDAILRARYPDRRYELVNHGITSETISGTSEPDHDPRRPDAHDRFDRDVAAWKPDVVVACFGMNDGNYHPPDEGRFAKFRDGIRRLISRCDEAGARLVLLTPPPFDPYRRMAGDPDAREFGYKYPAVDYDETLRRFAAWERNPAGPGPENKGRIPVVDLHTQLNDHLSRRREDTVSFHLAPDAVHPNETGHLLMALGIVDHLDLPETWAECVVDAASGEVATGDISDVHRDGETLSFRWTRPLPIPRDPAWDERSLSIEHMPARLGHDRLIIRELPAGRYRVSFEYEGEEEILTADVESSILGKGYPVPWQSTHSLQRQADELLTEVIARRSRQYQGWREAIHTGNGEPESRGDLTFEDDARLRELARPRTVEVRVRRVGE